MLDAALEVTVAGRSQGPGETQAEIKLGTYAITGTRRALEQLRSLIDTALVTGRAVSALTGDGVDACQVEIRVRATAPIAPVTLAPAPVHELHPPARSRNTELPVVLHAEPTLPAQRTGKPTVTTRVRLEAALDAVHGRALARQLRASKHASKAERAATAGIEAAAEVELGLLRREAELIERAMRVLSVPDTAISMEMVLECGCVRFLPSRLIAFWPG